MLSFSLFLEDESQIGSVSRTLGKLGSGVGAVIGAGVGGDIGLEISPSNYGLLGGAATGGTVGFMGGEQLGRLIGRPIDWIIRKTSPSEEKEKTPETGAIVVPSN